VTGMTAPTSPPALGDRAPARERVPGEGLVPGRGPWHLDRGPGGDAPVIGVLALQGDVLEHLRVLEAAGVRALPVKRPEQLGELDGIIIPGGESTTIGKLAAMYGLLEPMRQRIAAGLPAYGTCAGAILLGRTALGDDGRPSEQPLLGCMDVVVRRNAFGRQVDSFEADLDVPGIEGGPVRAVFIRAPWIESVGDGVEVLGSVTPLSRDRVPLGAKVVLARQGHMLASAFHPELTGDNRVHLLFIQMVRARRAAGPVGATPRP
jgi:pyridoxal 5'-phosphate synthase pdxT subunit